MTRYLGWLMISLVVGFGVEVAPCDARFLDKDNDGSILDDMMDSQGSSHNPNGRGTYANPYIVRDPSTGRTGRMRSSYPDNSGPGDGVGDAGSYANPWVIDWNYTR
jgi:hypothetical protein